VRLVLEILVQARRYGAVLANHAEVVDLDGGEEMCSATVDDTITDNSFEIRARRIVVAAGVWADRLESMARPEAEARLRPSKGIHLLFSRATIPVGDAAALVPDAERKRLLFVIPWHDAVLVGTTDTAYDGDIDMPSVEQGDREYCLSALNKVFGLDLGDADIAGAYAGLRPLVAGRADATADLSRKHTVYDIAEGITGITGGKLTTWRRMARDATDRVASELGVAARSRTRWIRLGCSDVTALTLAVDRRARGLGLPSDAVVHLIRNFGDRALDVLTVAAEHDMTVPLAPGHPPIAAEALYCARFEMVTHLADLLCRRTRLALTDAGGGIGPGSLAADVLAGHYRWSRKEKQRQLASHRGDLERERGLPLGGAVEAPPAGGGARAGAG
jgi:glycerol-3-phosphate dehydrogenase